MTGKYPHQRFLEISTISGYITPFPEIVIRSRGDFQITSLAIVEIDLPGWCAAKFDQLVSCAGRQKVWGPLLALPALIFFKSLGRMKSRHVNCKNKRLFRQTQQKYIYCTQQKHILFSTCKQNSDMYKYHVKIWFTCNNFVKYTML